MKTLNLRNQPYRQIGIENREGLRGVGRGGGGAAGLEKDTVQTAGGIVLRPGDPMILQTLMEHKLITRAARYNFRSVTLCRADTGGPN